MGFPELPQNNSPPSMEKQSPARLKINSSILFLVATSIIILTIWILSSSFDPINNFLAGIHFSNNPDNCSYPVIANDPIHDPSFYDDDPDLSYSIGGQSVVKNWDLKRQEWLQLNPSFAPGRVVMVTGSQPGPCKNPIGDHFLLRFFKNKVDYCRIHGYDIFYNNNLLHPKMNSYWAKLPAIRSAMLAHPEAEWIWWVDSDAAITDMDFKLPLNRYKDHNLVVHGWANLIYEKRSWTSLNAGVLLIRNCQWSIDLIEVWAAMGPQNADYDKWGRILRSTLPDKMFPESDDQSGLVYLILKGEKKWTDKIYLEGGYYFEGYWLEIVGTLDEINRIYFEGDVLLRRRRRSEKMAHTYNETAMRELRRRRPFVTHFTGCQPCSGDHNGNYSGASCWDGMQKALNFADNQVIRSYGFVHPDLLNSSYVSPSTVG
ncbi:putative glycosyltransferase 7 [Impatiens glandulifera]|uniref:putative glycosyltransferase 7 n=1 Tax=Impatiens glandulifera TaxID=253017 RepID=UPI001FB08AF3|nr:putative glycosyltransferase 7 [Impatiens glandulifera]